MKAEVKTEQTKEIEAPVVMTEEKKGIYAVTTVALVKLKKSRPICFIISVWKRYRKNFLNKIFLLHSIVCLLIV